MSDKKTVYITDDSQAYLTYLGSIMNRMGFIIKLAKDGLALLKMVKIQKPDLIMLDINMSQVDGVKALKFLKEDPNTSNIPVIMITSDSSKETVARCKELGCESYLVKPVHVNDLHAALQDNLYSNTDSDHTRDYLRAMFNEKVKIKFNNKVYDLYAETLSERGIFILMDEPLPVGADVAVRISLDNDKKITLSGKIIYHKNFMSRTDDVSRGISVQFSDENKDKLYVISDFVKGLLTVPYNIPVSNQII
jgi:two-component system cell cycle response regulator DivK